MRVQWTGRGNANGFDVVLRPDGFNGLYETIIDAGLSCKRACAFVGNRCNAVGFIDSNADMCSADVDCYSVAHVVIIPRETSQVFAKQPEMQ